MKSLKPILFRTLLTLIATGWAAELQAQTSMSAGPGQSVATITKKLKLPTTAAKTGLVTLQSKYRLAETIERFEAAVRAKKWVVFTRIDHAAAAKEKGLQLLPRTVIIFGNPKDGTPPMQTNPTLAIDFPLKALVWQDENEKVWLTYNSIDYLGQRIYARHGLNLDPEPFQDLGKLLGNLASETTR